VPKSHFPRQFGAIGRRAFRKFTQLNIRGERKREDAMAITVTRLICNLLLLALIFSPATTGAEPPKLPVPAIDQSALGQRGFFYVGGKYVGEPGKEIMQGQAYVEVLAPKDVRRPYPLVLMYGAGITATIWMGTPDGRKGWADYFVEQGYVVYLMEQPMRGRSVVHVPIQMVAVMPAPYISTNG
jgi:hypothetical protein